jgi:competence ComEA-like helix-hairpin-helix protein
MAMRRLIFALTLILLTLSTTAMAEATPSGVVNINAADAAQLALLPRIGEKVAQRIVEYRNEHHGFRSVSDLANVKGIGEKTVVLLTPYVALEGQTTLTKKVAAPRKAHANKPAITASN